MSSRTSVARTASPTRRAAAPCGVPFSSINSNNSRSGGGGGGGSATRCVTSAHAEVAGHLHNGVIIPQHLRYRPLQVPNDFQHVESRFRSPPKRRSADQAAYYRERLDALRPPSPPRSREFQHVESRYRSPPKPRPPPQDAAATDAAATAAREEHRRFAAAQGICAVAPKYFEVHMRPPSAETPRTDVEQRQKAAAEKVKRDGQQFRIVHVKEKSFKDMERSNRELRERWSTPPKRSAASHSVVMDFVKKGIPIAGYDATPAPRPEPPQYVSREAFHGAGGAGGGSFLRRANSPRKVQAAAEERKVQELSTALQTARTRSPPRVAALDNRLARASRLEKQQQQQQRSPQRRTGSPSRRGAHGSTAASLSQQAAPAPAPARGEEGDEKEEEPRPNGPRADGGASYFQHSGSAASHTPLLFDLTAPKVIAPR